MRLVIATHNLGKYKELVDLLYLPDVQFLSLNDFPWIKDIEETGNSFRENALIKATTANKMTGLPAIGDDSGLEIFELGMFPGIFSARCAGENATDVDKINFILNKMKGKNNRSARFKCVLCYVGDNIEYFEGISTGKILEKPCGYSPPSLPYDRIFFHSSLGKTFAEVSSSTKGVVSHRGRAARKARRWIQSL